ncbi:hypothetical protein BU23DRAFT_123737 [Bimuria novae-zelandiae CBS 107.79]|uniref:Uncharacterized protein n=1 Tax=Bimuria novae-zelandiae CBS 107.79 TaxID=1447943 RepID=A0A6A5VAP0_9PLEO|nr:hypothetical protein BU23DRAFT_123737 [Bimuria novae-zelandiae CBS 107.79]
MRKTLDEWSNTTFAGEKDASNYTFLDYLSSGSLISNTLLPSSPSIESFYTTLLASTVINSQWRKRKIYTTFYPLPSPTANETSFSGPNATRYYSPTDSGVYYTYAYHETGVLAGYPSAPDGLADLNASSWAISGEDITKSSAASFAAGRYNFTQDMGMQALRSAIAANGTASLSPWDEGAAWIGTWTLPVCVLPASPDMNTQYGNTSSRYGVLPCCCGEGCKDTKEFVEAANMKGFQTLLYGCEEQLRGTGIEFSDIDYGFGKKKGPAALPFYWATLSTGKKAGLAIGMIAGGLFVLVLLFSCLAACCG